MAAIEPVQCAASNFTADFRRLGEQVEEAMKAGIRRTPVDVIDGRSYRIQIWPQTW